jgi:hypothetical protein
MSRALSFAIFAGTALLITASVHYYIWARLVRDVGLPPLPYRLLTGLVIALFVSVPLTMWLGRSSATDSWRPLVLGLWAWTGFMFLLLMLLGATDLGRLVTELVARLGTERPPADPERRLTLSRILGGGVALIAGGMGAVAVRSGLGELVTREVKVALERLPRALSGTTIVQITDLHVGPTIRKEFVEEVVLRVNALEPDVIAITGDLVDGSVAELGDHVAPLGRLRAKHGVYFVTGNHEYYSGVEEWCRELTRLGIRVLRNERVSIGDGDASFDLAGVDDFSSARFGKEPDVQRALVYVSNGTGYWGPPMRLGAPAEITRVVLLAPGERTGVAA